MWIKPITNRVQSDIDELVELNDTVRNGSITEEELNKWLEDSPAAFNKSDMERLVNNISLLESVLETGVTLPTVVEFPSVTWFSILLTAVTTLRDAYTVYDTTPAVPVQPVNDIYKLNDIEQILTDVYRILNSNFFYYCGDQIYAGENIGTLL